MINPFARIKSICGIPADKIGHLVAGLIWAVAGIIVAWLGATLGLWPITSMPVAALLPPMAAGATKEYADKLDNDLMASEGNAPIHGVEFADFAATSAPGIILSAASIIIMPWLSQVLS